MPHIPYIFIQARHVAKSQLNHHLVSFGMWTWDTEKPFCLVEWAELKKQREDRHRIAPRLWSHTWVFIPEYESMFRNVLFNLSIWVYFSKHQVFFFFNVIWELKCCIYQMLYECILIQWCCYQNQRNVPSSLRRINHHLFFVILN